MRRTIAACIAVALLVGAGTASAAKLISSSDIRNGTIRTVDMSSSAKRALKGQRGPSGPSGPAGPAGPAGPSAVGQITRVSSGQVPFGSNYVQSALAVCPAGQRVVSGGGASISDEQLAASQPTSDRSGWFVIGVDLSDNGGEYIEAVALCAPAGVAVAASTHAKALDQIDRLTAKLEAQHR